MRHAQLTAVAFPLAQPKTMTHSKKAPLATNAFTVPERRWLATEAPEALEFMETCSPEVIRALYPDVLQFPPEYRESIALREAYSEKLQSIPTTHIKLYVAKKTKFMKKHGFSKIQNLVEKEFMAVVTKEDSLTVRERRFSDISDDIHDSLQDLKTKLRALNWVTYSLYSTTDMTTQMLPIFMMLVGEGVFSPRSNLEKFRKQLEEPVSEFLTEFTAVEEEWPTQYGD